MLAKQWIDASGYDVVAEIGRNVADPKPAFGVGNMAMSNHLLLKDGGVLPSPGLSLGKDFRGAAVRKEMQGINKVAMQICRAAMERDGPAETLHRDIQAALLFAGVAEVIYRLRMSRRESHGPFARGGSFVDFAGGKQGGAEIIPSLGVVRLDFRTR